MVLFEHAWESTTPFYLQPFHMTFSLVLSEHACRDKNTLSTRFDGTLQCILVDILSISSNAWDLIMAKRSIFLIYFSVWKNFESMQDVYFLTKFIIFIQKEIFSHGVGVVHMERFLKMDILLVDNWFASNSLE